jgi:hypothetical protein
LGGATSSPEPSEEPTDEAPEESDPDAIPSEYPEAGLTFTNMPDLQGKWRGALRTYVDYQRGVGVGGRNAEVSALVHGNASAELIDQHRQSVKYQQDNDVRFGGEVVIEFLESRRRTDALLVLETCVDTSSEWLEIGGERRPVDGAPRGKALIVVHRGDDGWLVVSSTRDEGGC